MFGVMATTLEVVAVVTELEDWGADVVLGGTAEMTQMLQGLMELNFEETTGLYISTSFSFNPSRDTSGKPKAQ